MGRPKSHCTIACCPGYTTFKPVGCSQDVECIEITREEIESLRLKNIKKYDQTKSAEKMGVSQSTFQRILSSAYKKISQALVEGKELQIV